MGKTYSTAELSNRVTKAINWSDFDGSALYGELSQLGNGTVKAALDELLTQLEKKPSSETLRKYVAVIRSSCVRDSQCMISWCEELTDGDHVDDDRWVDADNPLFLEIIKAPDKNTARNMAACHAGIDPSVVDVYEV